jgi:hypothetical protein
MAIIDIFQLVFYFIPIGSNALRIIVGNMFDLFSLILVFIACGPIALTGIIEFLDVFLLFINIVGGIVFVIVEIFPAWLIIVIVWYLMKRFGVD